MDDVDDGLVGVEGLFAAAEDDGVAGFDAQGGGKVSGVGFNDGGSMVAQGLRDLAQRGDLGGAVERHQLTGGATGSLAERFDIRGGVLHRVYCSRRVDVKHEDVKHEEAATS